VRTAQVAVWWSAVLSDCANFQVAPAACCVCLRGVETALGKVLCWLDTLSGQLSVVVEGPVSSVLSMSCPQSVGGSVPLSSCHLQRNAV
jgi:hypothetical protein